MDCFFFQAEDGIRCLVRSRGLGDVYKRQEGLSRPSQVPAKRCGNPPECKKADRRAALAMTNREARDDIFFVIANRFAMKD